MNYLLSFIRRKILRIPADRWDHQYQRGEWDSLGQESSRFDAVIRLMSKDRSRPSILEIGCGPALLLQQMKPAEYSRFTGIDLSAVAINTARQYENEDVHFFQSDMQTFVPDATYDIIAFNESLYYVKDPAAVFARYTQYLNPNGSIIITAFEHKHTAHLWPALESKWSPVHKELISSGNHKWSVRMYQPKSSL
jgi:2-polyprenyl-3-methyl-5-hydroxy-6-metoxy-1,4-benzoquinol methylase